MARASLGTRPSRLSQVVPTATVKGMRTKALNGTLGTDGTHVPLALSDLAARVARLSPSHRDPERFHEEKSEIEHALRLIAREVSRG